MHRTNLTVLLACLCLLLLPSCGEDEPAGRAGANTEAPSTGDAGGTGSGGTGPGSAGSGTDSGRPAMGVTGVDRGLAKEIAEALAKGRAYLLTQQDDKGGFGDTANKIPGNVAYTAMAVHGVIAATDRTQVANDPAVRKGLAFIRGFAQENGAIFDNPKIANYATGVSVSALAAARIAAFAKTQAAAAAYLEASQIQGDPKGLSFGGFPYKAEQSADASNALMATTALEDNGLPADSPVRKRIGTFVGRIQNHSETNTGERRIIVDDEERIVVSGVDGGGVYRPDESKAGMVKRADGRWELRSYGSMTYAVLKLLLFAGTKAEDTRVKAVVRWISNNWTVAHNPGFEMADDPDTAGQQGYFYYLYTLSRALSAYEKSTRQTLVVTDADGRAHDWRAEVARELLSRQADDGSWRNEVAKRWEEGSQTLATGFAMQTLGYVSQRLP